MAVRCPPPVTDRDTLTWLAAFRNENRDKVREAPNKSSVRPELVEVLSQQIDYYVFILFMVRQDLDEATKF